MLFLLGVSEEIRGLLSRQPISLTVWCRGRGRHATAIFAFVSARRLTPITSSPFLDGRFSFISRGAGAGRAAPLSGSVDGGRQLPKSGRAFRMRVSICKATMSASRGGSRAVSTITDGAATTAKSASTRVSPTATTVRVRCPFTTASAFSAVVFFSPMRCREMGGAMRCSGRLRSEVAAIMAS